MPMLDLDRRRAVDSLLDGASYLLSPVGEPSLRPLAGIQVVSADHAALLEDWCVCGLDLRAAAIYAVREHDAAQGRLFELDALDGGNGGFSAS